MTSVFKKKKKTRTKKQHPKKKTKAKNKKNPPKMASVFKNDNIYVNRTNKEMILNCI